MDTRSIASFSTKPVFDMRLKEPATYLLVGFLFCLPLIPANLLAAGERRQTTSMTAVMAAKAKTVQELRKAGWRAPHPPYPAQARIANEQGDIYLEIATDKTGKVVRSVPPKDDQHPLLTRTSIAFVSYNWQGPPNSTVIALVRYRLF